MCPLGSAPVAPGTLARLQAKLPNAMVSNSWGMTEAGPGVLLHAAGGAGPSRRLGRPADATHGVPHRRRRRHRAGRRARSASCWCATRAASASTSTTPTRPPAPGRTGGCTPATWPYLDEDGFLYIVGRQKDVIIRGGNNVHAADVEAVLYEHPGVQEAAVAGVAHPVLGEDVGAWVVLVAGATADGEELRSFCAERLSDYKVPRSWTFVDELPRNATGKVVKRDLPGRCGVRRRRSERAGREQLEHLTVGVPHHDGEPADIGLLEDRRHRARRPGRRSRRRRRR